VIEGRVRIDNSARKLAEKERMLAPGEEARIVADGRIVTREAPDVTQLAAWRQRRLVFKADSLEDIAAEFNRYNRAPKILIQGAEVRQLRFTGIFDADDPLSLVQLLGKDRELAFERHGDEWVIGPK
jgi:transmembrane sensor